MKKSFLLSTISSAFFVSWSLVGCSGQPQQRVEIPLDEIPAGIPTKTTRNAESPRLGTTDVRKQVSLVAEPDEQYSEFSERRNNKTAQIVDSPPIPPQKHTSKRQNSVQENSEQAAHSDEQEETSQEQTPDSSENLQEERVECDMAYRPSPRARIASKYGPLTAVTVVDADDRMKYLNYIRRRETEKTAVGLDLTRRVRIQIVDEDSQPVHDADLLLVRGDAQVKGKTHGDGAWDFFPSFSDQRLEGKAKLLIRAGESGFHTSVTIPENGDSDDYIVRLPGFEAQRPEILDLAFLIDATGSMSDELRYVNDEIVEIVDRVQAEFPNTRVRVAATFYRDRNDYLPVSQIGFSQNVRNFASVMNRVTAYGGGDLPEDLNLGLATSLTSLEWSTEPAVRVLVVISDAPPQAYSDFPYTYNDALVDVSRRGIRILPIAASGADRTVEYLFRAFATFTSTPYVHLTDDSGIGDRHLIPDADTNLFLSFTYILSNLLISDLRGDGMHQLVM